MSTTDTMAASGLKREKIKFNNSSINRNFRFSLSKRSIETYFAKPVMDASTGVMYAQGITGFAGPVGIQGAVGMQGPVGVQGIQGGQGNNWYHQANIDPMPQFEEWQTIPQQVHAVITEEMIEREMRTPFQRFIHMLGF